MMDRFLFKISRASSAVLAATLLLTGHSDVQAQITSDVATESTDEVQRTDGTYQVLQQLQAKYNCVSANSAILNDRRQTISRAEFAAEIQNCAQSIEQLIARKPRKAKVKKRMPAAEVTPVETSPAITPPAPTEIKPLEPAQPEVAAEPAVTQQDLDRLKGLVESFRSELQAVDTRVQALDSKTATLKSQSFSSTTKLAGEVIVGFSGYGGVRETVGTSTLPGTGNIFSDRVRLNFDTSFTGKDRLRTRLQSRNTTPFNSAVTRTNMTRLGYDGNSDNNTGLSLLQYSFPLSSETKIIAETVGSEFNENMYTFNPILASSGSGSISRFGRFNPVYRLSNDGASLTVNHKFSNELDLSVGYAVPGVVASNPAANNGLFNGSNAIISQLNFRPADTLNLGLIYARSYHNGGTNLSGGTGSSAADNPFGGANTSANHYSVLASYKVDPQLIVSGWAGFTEAKRETAAGGSASMSNYALSLAVPDFGQKGNNLAFIVGVPPKLNSRSGTGLTASPNTSTSYHIEALYKMKLTDNIDLTPGLLLITNPEHNSANPTAYVGTIRTTFKF